MPTEMPNERSLRASGSMELDPAAENLATDETPRLIAASKVENSVVFDRSGEQLGTIAGVMIDKVSGQVAYVVMSSGGFLGIGESHHPLPWRSLTYDQGLGGYVVDIDRNVLAERSTPDPGPALDPQVG